jgi:ABC-2 type transport system permease protein
MIKDTSILFGRTLKHVTRSFDTVITTAVMPILFMLLFVYVFGGAIKASLGGGTTYVNYLVPGILPMSIGMGVSYVGFRLFEDKQKGMFARIKSMPISSSSFLWAHVLVSLISNVISLALVFLVAFITGFRTNASLGNWLLAIGILFVLTLSLTWLMVIPGVLAKTMTGASVLAYPLTFLPMLSSAFAPTATMPGPVRWFADNQPITLIVDSLRNLFAGKPAGNELTSAMIWCLAILLVSYVIARQVYKKAV